MEPVAPLISLVLATVDRSDALQPLLCSLLAQTERRFELVVVDQNHDDRLQAVLHTMAAGGVAVQHLHQSERNLSRARNRGLQAARAALVAFPDDDAWYEPDTLQVAVQQLQQSADDDGLIAHWVDIGPPAGARAGLADLSQWRRFRGPAASSISLFLRTDVARRWGGFDDDLGVGRWYGAGEETDLVLRALAAGARLRHVDDVRVRHAAPLDRAPAWSTAVRRARGTGALYVKHRLPVWVVVRGLLSPLLLSLANHSRALPWRHALALSVGRAQGLLGWSLGLHRTRHR